ncbi:pimeloyl-ACP methyl ester carboxylesterase [Haloactinospora alba]|uniref:Pimeloyl-ACP methyl ester carboxylesterase n=1 Tax=Haloactinospora alba TaxID=405555 RepID=A0A543NN29_9ACTN|nr:alpha/beta hydrolase [Haloactinospora alba]TQN33239.1 pimeloyl-ACP methyl ester carboxylesterase [Haloactinospora alba]
MNADTPPDIPRPYSEVRRRLPGTALINVRPGLSLETMHVPGPSPALVLVHGGLGNLWNFYPQLDRFAGHRELVAYSLAGNGRSEDRAQHSLSGHVRDLAELLAALDVARPVVVGWSYGTAVALEYAKNHPVSGLVLTAGGAFGLTPVWELPLLKLVTALRLYRVLPGGAALRSLAKRTMLHPDSPDSLAADMVRSNPLPRRASAWRTVTDAFWGYDGRDGLDAITCPTLVAHGSADRVVPREAARRTAELLPRGEFHELDRSGHVTVAEQPEAFGALVDSVVNRV